MHGLSAFLVLLAPVSAAGQGGDVEAAEWTGTHDREVRWLHSQQVPGLTSFQAERVQLLLDSSTVANDRLFRFRVTGRSGRNDRPAGLRIPADGSPVEAWVEPPDLIVRPGLPWSRGFRHSHMASELTLGGGAMLDDARLWHIAPFVLPELRPGATATTALDLRARRFGFVQAMAGPQVITLERDTLVAGRRLWIGRDSARIRYHERVLAPRRSLDTVVVIDREVEGILRGRFLFDPELGLFRGRTDTLIATGTAVLRLPDGRAYRTPASYEWHSEWTVRTPAEQVAWEAEEQRRQRAMGRARARLDSVPPEAGGWIARIRAATSDVWGGPPIDSATMAGYIRLLGDPGLAHAHGVNPDAAYENLAGGLVLYPPSLGAPAERASCTPAACRLLAAQSDAAEPRLRQVALVAAFILEPESWADSLLSRRDTAAHLLHEAVLLARGVGATWPAAEKMTIPREGAGWREWLRWTGTDPADPLGLGHGRPPPIRFRTTHEYAVRMAERLTGRNIGRELAAAADTATHDSARLVFRTLGLRLGAIRPTLEEVVAGLLSEDNAERRLALTGLGALDPSFIPADSALRHEIVGQLLDQVLGGDSIWSGRPGRDPPRPLNVNHDQPEALHIYLAGENIPRPLLDVWGAAGFEVTTRQEWRAQPPRSPGVFLEVRPTMVLGPLVRVGIDRFYRQARTPEQGPRLWAAGASYLLIRTDEGWVIVAKGEWIT